MLSGATPAPGLCLTFVACSRTRIPRFGPGLRAAWETWATSRISLRMEPLLADSSPSPRIQAVRAGARIAARSQAVPPLVWGRLLAGLIDDSLPGVRAIALESAAPWVPQPEVRQAVLRRLAKGEPRERELALLALAQAADPEAGEAIRIAAGADRANSAGTRRRGSGNSRFRRPAGAARSRSGAGGAGGGGRSVTRR